MQVQLEHRVFRAYKAFKEKQVPQVSLGQQEQLVQQEPLVLGSIGKELGTAVCHTMSMM
jgi:hypothetical protein